MDREDDLSWTVQTHTHKEHSTDWYWGFGLLAVVTMVVSVYFSNVLLAVIIAIGAFSIGMLIVRGPREHMIKINRRGVILDGTLYRWEALHSFWVEHDVHDPHVFISTTGYLTPHISFPLENMEQGDEVRGILRRFVKEVEQGPHLGDHLAELIGL